ncbi:coiled-coil domain-containing protein 151 isoform X2 [Brienomyrus brachyistius]|uniref:coiled-coil domain-containing protein 151 isoform X2 n=1 Tax=Brienomyrus brachyistius TaxID=42636 RepID=UPI0020B1BC81|nr:coiled-coil domain-containing protein 151 isoform X2 [Brienomyrus brachyistius]
MPGPFNSDSIKHPIHDQITELQRKIQLLEGDRCAYYESSQETIKKNKEAILRLRHENKGLRRRLADAHAGDEQVTKDAFQNRGTEKAAFRNKSGKEAVQILDQKVSDKIKKLNALKHRTESRRRHLQELQLQCHRAQSAGQASHQIVEEREEEAKNLRVLENRLEKAQLKCQEAEHITRGYLKLKAHLQEESLTFQSQLDGLEAEILRERQELRELQVMHADAQLSRDAAKAELQRQEDKVYRERRAREGILVQYKKQAEDRRAHTERAERRAQRVTMHPDEMSSEAQRSVTGVGEEEKVISTYEEAFQHIKEATGVTDAQEIVERFVTQGNTQKHLEHLKVENEKMLQQLKVERDQLQAQFQDMKYSGEAKLSSDQQVLNECEFHLQREWDGRDKVRHKLDWLTRTLNAARGGVEHLADKLRHIALDTGFPVPELDPSSESYILELLTQSEWKLLQLREELHGTDMEAVMKEMEEEEFHATIEGKLPAQNMRIRLPQAQRQDPYEDDEKSGDDESDIITRAALKRQSQMIIDSRTKRKTRIRKKKNKL